MKNPDRYTHNKFFIVAILVGILISIFLSQLTNSGDDETSWQAGGTLVFIVIPLVAGLIFWWPIDYFVHKRTLKQMKSKPWIIDPNFKLKRAILIGAIVVVGLIIYAVNLITSLHQPNY